MLTSRLSAALTLLALTVACSGKDAPSEEYAAVPSGSFTDGTHTLDVDTAALTALVTLADESTVELTLTVAEESLWLTSDDGLVSEVYTLSPDPVVLGSLSFASPVLTTTDGADVILGALVDGALDGSELIFTAQ
ncbi:hypothetical protein L6R49_17670 [Myxococcota bacterium]|nr:hypothetical protein [Myxococcota bacterium]